jgi:hypothetical protein
MYSKLIVVFFSAEPLEILLHLPLLAEDKVGWRPTCPATQLALVLQHKELCCSEVAAMLLCTTFFSSPLRSCGDRIFDTCVAYCSHLGQHRIYSGRVSLHGQADIPALSVTSCLFYAFACVLAHSIKECMYLLHACTNFSCY